MCGFATHGCLAKQFTMPTRAPSSLAILCFRNSSSESARYAKARAAGFCNSWLSSLTSNSRGQPAEPIPHWWFSTLEIHRVCRLELTLEIHLVCRLELTNPCYCVCNNSLLSKFDKQFTMPTRDSLAILSLTEISGLQARFRKAVCKLGVDCWDKQFTRPASMPCLFVIVCLFSGSSEIVKAAKASAEFSANASASKRKWQVTVPTRIADFGLPTNVNQCCRGRLLDTCVETLLHIQKVDYSWHKADCVFVEQRLFFYGWNVSDSLWEWPMTTGQQRTSKENDWQCPTF